MEKVLVKLRGQIVFVSTGSRADSLTLRIQKRSAEFPRVYFVGKKRALIAGFKEGDYIEIDATVNMRSRKTSNGKYHFTQPIIAESVSRPVSETMKIFGNDFGTYDPINYVCITGTFYKMNKYEKRIDVLVRPEGSKALLIVSCYDQRLFELIESLKKDDPIYVYGEFRTRLKMIEQTKRRFQDIAVLNISRQ